MSVLLLLIPAALSLAGAGAGGAVVVTGASAAIGFAALGGTVAGTVIGLKIKHGHSTDAVCYETHFADLDLLVAALGKNGCRVSMEDDHLSAWFGEHLAMFRKNESGSLDAYLDSKIPMEQVKSFFEGLYASYTAALQEKLYNQVLERAQENGMKLEQEIVHEDNSIELVMLVEEKNG